MHPVLFHIGSFPAPTHFFISLIGSLLALMIAMDRGAKVHIKRGFILKLFLLSMITSVVGAKALYVLEQWKDSLHHSDLASILLGGTSYYGGLASGVLLIVIGARMARQNVAVLMDVVMPSVALHLAVQRLGCYCTGCCYGIIDNGVWGVAFPKGSVVFVQHVINRWVSPFADASLPVIPTQLISSFLDILLFCLLVAVDDRKKVPGITSCAYFLGYGIIRFCVEFLRGDTRLLPVFHLGWTSSQFISMGLIVAGIAGLAVLSAKEVPKGEECP